MAMNLSAGFGGAGRGTGLGGAGRGCGATGFGCGWGFGSGCGLGCGWGCGWGSGCASCAGCGSPSAGATSGAACALGSGEVDLSAISSENVTVMRSGGGCSFLPGGDSVSARISAACAATAIARATPSSFERPGAEGSRIVDSAYGVAAEPLVTSEIDLNPALFSSPITAITRP